MMKKFRTDVILSAITGWMCCNDFGAVHEVIEHMAGAPVWTHQLPELQRLMLPAMRAAFPDLADWDISGLNRDTSAAWIAEREHLLAVERDVPVFGGSPDNPFAYLPDATVIPVVMP